MLSTTFIVLAALVWLGLLFLAALIGERRARRGRLPGAWTYSLALGVYCTSWTFYGTVTQALRSGWWLPPTFVGTMLLFVVAWPFLQRLVGEAHAQNSTTLADFVAAKLGKSSSLAAVITGVVLLGTLPYLALQLKAVSTSFDLLAGRSAQTLPTTDSALWVALIMAIFAILFGTRRAAASDRNPGLVLAIAFESLFKLVALMLIGVFVVFVLHEGPLPLAQEAHAGLAPAAGGSDGFLTLIVLGALAMFTLPHQFHVGVIECADQNHVNKARWRFPLFLALIALPTLPLAWAGALALGDRLPSDLYVLGLPLSAGRPLIALLAFLGGLSAATAMVVVATLALSLMIGNHWLAPALGPRWARGEGAADLRGQVLALRRVGIVAVLLLAWLYSRLIAGNDALADIGAQSFSALAQLAPAVLIAIYAPRMPARAVLAGLVGGVLVWGYVLLLPQLVTAAGQTATWIGQGPLGLSWFAPGNLLGLGALEGITRATLVGFAMNFVLMLVFSRRTQERRSPDGKLAIGDLHRLAARFLETSTLRDLFGAQLDGRAEAGLVARVEHALAGVIGAASARVLLDALARHDVRELETVAELVGETSQALRFNQQLLEAALENMSQGISVVDKDLQLVAWNSRYAELFRFPPSLLRIGTPIDHLVRCNATLGFLGGGDVDALVERRLAHMRAGTPYVSERTFIDGTVVEIRGNPMPGGGFVATFTDVTTFRHTEVKLKQIAETLEQRVIERTAESEHARAEAERANRAKSRFLAAISHDLAQPLNAAKLFTHALAQKVADDARHHADVENIGGALQSTEELLAGLLDISRLDAGGMNPQQRAFPLGDMLQHLAIEFGVLAAEKDLVLHAVPTRAWVSSDPQLLRRVLQNFLANAVRYTLAGRVLLGCRRRGDRISIEVWDSGPGIAESEQSLVFEEFRRLDRNGQGLGLGLAIAERIARLLGHSLRLRSWPGKGTVFAIEVPSAQPQNAPPPVIAAEAPSLPFGRVLVVDNDATVLKAMRVLLEGWNCQVLTARNGVEAMAMALSGSPDLLLLDYHLDGAETGLVLRARLAQTIGDRPAIVITADHGETVRSAVMDAGCHLLHKPLKPLALRSLMSRLLATHTTGTVGRS
jgi:signal transduction histidine kinase